MIAHLWIIIIFLLTVVFSSWLFANPFDSFESELKDYIESENYQYYDPQDNQIKEIFTSDEEKSEDSGNKNVSYSPNSSNYKLPSHIAVSRLISTSVIRSDSGPAGSYKVKSHDTLSSIARRYKTKVDKIKKMNNLRSDLIRIGQVLRISGAQSQTAATTTTIYKMKVFAMPVISGRVTSRFGHRRDPFNPNIRNFHSGLDLSAPVGTPVIASADGVVEFKGRNGGYGNTVIIRHKGGYKTTYAHCSSTTVEVGDSVKMGTVIGSVGRTGTATGAHLHFEVTYKSRLIDPEKALRKVEIVTTKISSGVSKS